MVDNIRKSGGHQEGRLDNKTSVSVAIITKNEGSKLEDCLKSASPADEIVIVDSGSTDDTIDIAGRFGCKIFREPWKGYGPQKQTAIDRCSHEWVLILDADERVPESTWSAIEEALSACSGEVDAFSFPRKNYFAGKWLKHGYEWPDRGTRLLRKSTCSISGIVHEDVTAKRIVKLHAPFIHEKNYAMNDYLVKLNSYSTLLAEKTLQTNPGKKSGVRKAFFSFLAHFCRSYFLKKGFLDGSGGFIVSFTEALHSFYKHIKIMELRGEIVHKSASANNMKP
jgi:glycosyltransferase involved in cell wall biosynthesis